MKQFLFITHKTPSVLQTPLRKQLFELYLEALNQQTYKQWKLLIIGEEESQNDRIKIVKLDSSNREVIPELLEKIYDRVDVCEYLESSDYIVKLDDDDIMSPTVLQSVAEKTFDVYHDDWHTFYDISSGQITQQQRAWIPSTCIHSTKHALSPITLGEKNYYRNSVLYTDHALVWHNYYHGKNVVIAPKEHPVYLRILSPTSITAGGNKRSAEDIDFEHYYSYLKSFGYWKPALTKDFDRYLQRLSEIWRNSIGVQQKPLPRVSGIAMVVDKMKAYGKVAGKLFR